MNKDMPRPTSVEDSSILNAFNQSEGPIATVSDISEVIDLHEDSIRNRLKQLEEEGRVTSKQVGARAVVWWRNS